jgi:hypothetical protein
MNAPLHSGNGQGRFRIPRHTHHSSWILALIFTVSTFLRSQLVLDKSTRDSDYQNEMDVTTVSLGS